MGDGDAMEATRVRRLGPGDESVLAQLAREDADFDLEGRGGPLNVPSAASSRAFLADPNVLFWIAERDATLVGLLHCNQVRTRDHERPELLLYEIGVRTAFRRQQVGRVLLDAMRDWMQAQAVQTCWVLGDNAGAVAFYQAWGFEIEVPAPTYLVWERGG